MDINFNDGIPVAPNFPVHIRRLWRSAVSATWSARGRFRGVGRDA
jgi:hypothetical protein